MSKFVLLALMVVGACTSHPPDALIEGGLYSTPNDDGTYSVIKILKLDDRGVHVRVYSNSFSAHPDTLEEGALYMAGLTKGPNERLGMGHLPLSRSSFARWRPRFIKRVEVKPDELDGYREWLAGKGGYF
jgi:hypothetical protein